MPPLVVFIIIGVLVSGFLNNKINQNEIANKFDNKVVSSIFPTISQSPTSTLSPTTVPKIDSNPMVTCTLSPECGGKKTMRKNECSSSVCCQVANQWTLFPNLESCKNAQKAYYDELLAQLKQKQAIDEAKYKAILEEISNSRTYTTTQTNTNTNSIDYSVPKPTVYEPPEYPTITPYQYNQVNTPKPIYIPPERRTGNCTPIGNDGKNVICDTEANSLRPLN